MQKKIYTIGYEGVTQNDFVAALRKAGVRMLIDVRAVPLSRKPGFSKNKLAERLAQEDIGYLGLKSLGTPAAGRDAARKGHIEEMARIFSAHLEGADAIKGLEDAIKAAQAGPACLLCFEHEADCCHRSIVADRIARKTGQKIVHLNPVIDAFL